MVDAGILDGDWVVVESRANARNGEMVVALIDGEDVTLKRIEQAPGRCTLLPANPRLRAHGVLARAGPDPGRSWWDRCAATESAFLFPPRFRENGAPVSGRELPNCPHPLRRCARSPSTPPAPSSLSRVRWERPTPRSPAASAPTSTLTLWRPRFAASSRRCRRFASPAQHRAGCPVSSGVGGGSS